MNPLLVSLAVLGAGTVAPALLARRPRVALGVALGAAGTAALIGLPAALGGALGLAGGTWSASWSVPLGSLTVGLDPLSGFFLVPILAVTAIAALAGHGLLLEHAGEGRAVVAAAALNALAASMALVVLARDAILFLFAWEAMSLASYFLITFHDEDPEVQNAGFVYLVASHLGTAFLLVFFVTLGLEAGSFAFADLGGLLRSAPRAHLLFACALLGFGVKAGLAPLHVWLPRAHPAAPSHVSAVLSGVMIKTGIYGLLRALEFLGAPSPAWAYTLIAIAAVSMVGGVLFALAQQDLKRLLAFSSIENIGVVALGLGAALLGRVHGNATVEALGLAGALVHVWNHAAFKSLLFLAAGAAVHGAGARDLDRLGGLMRRMPATGTLFLVGAAAICALPPLNGMIGEWLLIWGLFTAGSQLAGWPAMIALVSAAALGLAGALAIACFARAFGIAFLGTPRGVAGAHAHDPDRAALAAMGMLALPCVAIGVMPRLVLVACRPAVGALAADPEAARATLEAAVGAAGRLSAAALVLLLVGGALVALRRGLLRGRVTTRGPTWACGYAWPTPRMQYTAASFAQPVLELFRGVITRTEHREAVQGLFPGRASLEAHTEDPAERRLYGPAFTRLPRLLGRLRWMQSVPVQVQLLYILIGLLALLVVGWIGVSWLP